MKLAAFVSIALVMLAMVRPVSAANEKSPLDFKMESLDGKPTDLSQYKGNVVLIVNVASKCGLTPQYTQLEEHLHQVQRTGVAGARLSGQRVRQAGARQQHRDFDLLHQ